MADDKNFYFGGANDTAIQYDTTQTNDALIIGVGAGSEAVIIAQEGDMGYDFAHPEQINPTLYIQSNTQTDDEWISLSHDTEKGIIDSGTNVTEIASETNFNDEVFVGANLSVADSISDLDLFSIDSNGSNIIIESFQSLPIVIKTFSDNGTSYLCQVNDSGSFICA